MNKFADDTKGLKEIDRIAKNKKIYKWVYPNKLFADNARAYAG